MKRRIAHAMRRIARALIRWSMRFDPITFTSIGTVANSGRQAGAHWADRIRDGLVGETPPLP